MENFSFTDEFSFSLAPHTQLESEGGCFYLFSDLPVRILRLNESLFYILSQLQEKNSLAKVIHGSNLEKRRVLRILLSLVSRGYLNLEGKPVLQEYPFISIIVPVKNHPVDLRECLQSLARLNYPEDKYEIIVIDDGSRENLSTLVSQFNARYIRMETSAGQSAARNAGAEKAGGEILAFIDADCVAGPDWLSDLAPFFAAEGVGAAGGLVDGFFNKSFLDRYEKVSSSLNMGRRLIFQTGNTSNFYVPSCNLLVRKKAFWETGGFRTGMHLGEDVDFCWRMRSKGYDLIYLPRGKVAHKHRNQLLKLLRRRYDYGTSEASLYNIHKNKKKIFPLPIGAGLSFLAVIAAILLLSQYPLAAVPVVLAVDVYLKRRVLNRYCCHKTGGKIFSSVLRGYFSFFYFALFHLVRYYFILFLLLGILYHPVWYICVLAITVSSASDYLVKKPRLAFPAFLFFYIMEHLAYQMGVFWGCLRKLHFRSYRLVFRHA